MTEKEVIEIVKESGLWGSLTQKEKQDAIRHALNISHLSPAEDNADSPAEGQSPDRTLRTFGRLE